MKVCQIEVNQCSGHKLAQPAQHGRQLRANSLLDAKLTRIAGLCSTGIKEIAFLEAVLVLGLELVF